MFWISVVKHVIYMYTAQRGKGVILRNIGPGGPPRSQLKQCYAKRAIFEPQGRSNNAWMHDFLRLPYDQNNLPATVDAAIAASRLVVKMPPVLVAYWYHKCKIE